MRSTLLFALAFIASPALADHTGPGGIGSGSGIDVFSPDTLDAEHGGFGLRLLYTRPHQRSDATLHSLELDGIGAHNTDYNLNASLGIAYGITHHLTVSAELPYVRRDNLREGSAEGVERIGTVSGIGDANLLAKYRLTGEHELRFALIGGIKVPTGSTTKRSPDGERLETEHQPGTGSWDPIVGASAAMKAGWLQITASGLYQFSGNGAQDTELGDRLQGGILLSHHFGPAEAERHHEAGEDHHHHHDEAGMEPRHDSWDAFVEVGAEWEGRQKIAGEIEAGSGGTWVYAAPGVRFNSARGWSAAAAFAIPLWQDIHASHPNNDYRLMFSVGQSF
jgi:hypothetical protein